MPLHLPQGIEGQSGWIAGLSHGLHDSACVLLKDGQIVSAVEQERLSRHKRAEGEAPVAALRYCLDESGLSLSDLDLVALGSDHRRLAEWLGAPPAEIDLDDPARLFPRDRFGSGPRPPVVPVRHHLAHAASAAWPSGMDHPALLVMDAMGEDSSAIIAQLTDDGIEQIESFPVEVSLGYFYEAASEYCGLGRQAAGKLMGLAAYGKPHHDVGLTASADGISWVNVRPSGKRGRDLIENGIEQLLRSFELQSFPFIRGAKAEVMAYANFAASVQAALERVVLALAQRAQQLTNARTLGLAGGVALNCSANGLLAESGLFETVWIQPMSHDAGVALGAAVLTAHALGHDVAAGARMHHAYWGPSSTNTETAAAFEQHGVQARRLSDDALVREAAGVVAAGGVVAWHQGRAEVGPRALGARSFVADPRSRSSLIRLNQMKGREMWRPVAPSVLSESFDDYFQGVPNEFMLVAARVRSHVRRQIPAVVHVDGSARPQVVNDHAQPRFAELLRSVGAQTGHPLVVNTSLNLAGSPVCCSAIDTVGTFIESGADAVVIDEWIATR